MKVVDVVCAQWEDSGSMLKSTVNLCMRRRATTSKQFPSPSMRRTATSPASSQMRGKKVCVLKFAPVHCRKICVWKFSLLRISLVFLVCKWWQKRRKFLNFPSSSSRLCCVKLSFFAEIWCFSIPSGGGVSRCRLECRLQHLDGAESWRSESGKMSDLSWVNVWILMARVELLWRNFHWTTISNLKHFLLTRRRRHSISMILTTTSHNGWENDKVRSIMLWNERAESWVQNVNSCETCCDSYRCQLKRINGETEKLLNSAARKSGRSLWLCNSPTLDDNVCCVCGWLTWLVINCENFYS